MQSECRYVRLRKVRFVLRCRQVLILLGLLYPIFFKLHSTIDKNFLQNTQKVSDKLWLGLFFSKWFCSFFLTILRKFLGGTSCFGSQKYFHENIRLLNCFCCFTQFESKLNNKGEQRIFKPAVKHNEFIVSRKDRARVNKLFEPLTNVLWNGGMTFKFQLILAWSCLLLTSD